MFRAVPWFTLLVAALICSCSEKVDDLGDSEVIVEAERTAASKAQTVKDVQPYDEGLAWHEYRVKRVLGGKLKVGSPVIRVAHWTVLSAKPVTVSTQRGEVVTLRLVSFDSVPGLKNLNQSDDLEIVAEEPPRFLDMSQPHLQATPPSMIRYDYRGNVSEQMRLYWMLRGQLKVVAMGNSHATKGVNPRSIMDPDNWRHPAMLNMAPAGSNNDQQCLMLREYVLPLPKLEWLLWVVSARTFNADRSTDTKKYREFITSPGWLYDQQHRSEFWPVPPQAKLITTDEVKAAMGPMGLDVWGSLIVAKTLLPEDPAEQKKLVEKQCREVEFTWDDKAFEKFCDTARAFTERGVKVLIFTTPIHPLTKETAAADPDGTSHEGFREMVRHMEAFDKTVPGLWFKDYHKDGHHEFPPGEFYDVDHLDREGSGRLGLMIRQWMKECDTETATGGADAQ